MNVKPTLEADAQFAGRGKACMGALDPRNDDARTVACSRCLFGRCVPQCHAVSSAAGIVGSTGPEQCNQCLPVARALPRKRYAACVSAQPWHAPGMRSVGLLARRSASRTARPFRRSSPRSNVPNRSCAQPTCLLHRMCPDVYWSVSARYV